MTDTNPHLLRELASLPADHPERRAFEATLNSLASRDREHWVALTHETDLLNQALADVPFPEEFTSKLLQIPTAHAAPKRSFHFITAHPWYAAAAVFLLMVAGYAIYNLSANNIDPSPPPPLAANLVESISDWAVRTHQQPPKLDFVSNDIAVVESGLKSHPFPFPVMVLHPTQKEAELQGGGFCVFHDTPAVFTRWVADGKTYTLYQFDGKAVSAPARFPRIIGEPKTLWRATEHYRVAIWPGGPCTWALVLQDENTKDIFPIYY